MLVRALSGSGGGSGGANAYFFVATRQAVTLFINNDSILYNTQGNNYNTAINYTDDDGNITISKSANSDSVTLQFHKACQVTTITGTSGTEATTSQAKDSTLVVNQGTTSALIVFD